jgi:AraC-like DNA-binding protein
MVCNRCKMVVKSELEKFGLNPISVALGEVEISEELDRQKQENLNSKLLEFGFELLDDKKSRVIEKVKNLIVDLVHTKDNELKTNLSQYIAANIGQDYNYISNLFSRHESTTIEQYYALQKIERVKELIVYDELNLNEIADMLNYSSASHLTRQFRKVTGLTPTFFKSLKEEKRHPLENL